MSRKSGLGRHTGGRMKAVAQGVGVTALVLVLAACGSSSPSGGAGSTGSASSAGSASSPGSASSGATSAGSASSSTGATSASGSNAALPSSGCGSIPTSAPNDPSGLVGKLPADLAANYNLFPGKIAASTWAKWKPSHAGPYKVAVIWNPPINSFVTTSLAGLTSTLKASGQVDIVSSTAPKDPTDVPGNIQLYNQALAEKPDLIISFPLAAEPLIPAITAAAKEGIPTISAWVTTDSPDAISVGENQVLTAATLGAHVVTGVGGKGNALMVHGIPSVGEDIQAQAGFNAVLKNCADIKVVGQVTGNYAPAPAKAAVLQFLSGHPGSVDAVFPSGTMTVGVIQAFQQLGRKIPAIADDGTTQGSIAYAHQNKGSYNEYGASNNDTAVGTQTAKVALKLLSGAGGPVLNQLVIVPKIITPANVDQVFQDGWTLASQADAALPGDDYISDADISAFFGGK